MRNLLEYVGLRHMRLRPSRTLLTVLGVGFGIALYVAIAIINESTRESFRENVEAVSGKAKITISAGLSGFPEEKLDAVKAVPGVAHAVPMIEAHAYFKGAVVESESIYVLGVDLLQEASVRTYRATEEKVIDDPLIFLNQPDSIVVTKKFAESRNLKIDSQVTFATSGGAKAFTIRGLLEPEGAAKAYGGSLAIMDIDGARVSFGKVGKIDRIDIVPLQGTDTDSLIAAIQSKLGSGYTIERPETQSESTEKMIQSYQVMISFFGSLALLVGLFLVFNSVSMSVAERRREIGILRAIGASRNSILSLFVLESAFIGLMGAALGAILGRFLAEALVQQVMRSLSAQFHTSIQTNSLNLTFSRFMSTLLLGVATASIAAFIPAFRASRISPLEAMKSRGLESMREERGYGRSFAIGIFFLVFFFVSTRFHFNKHFAFVEQINQGSSVLGAAFLGPTLVFFLIRLFRKVVKAQRAPIFRLAQDNLLRSRRRTATNIMALMVGLFLVMLIATVRASFQDTLVNWLGEVLSADIIVTGSGRTVTARVQPVNPEIQDEILKVPGIRNPGEGRGTRSRIVQFSSGGVRYTIKAFDRMAEWSHNGNFKMKGRDRDEAVEDLFDPGRQGREPAIIVSENFFLKNPTKKVGDFLDLDTPSGRTPFRIIGICVDFASSTGVFYMTRETFIRYWKDPLVTGFSLHLEPGANLETVRSALARTVGQKYDLVAMSNGEMRSQMRSAIDETFAYTRAIEGAALMVALLGLLNTLLISILERTREFGVLRAIGSSRRQIFRMVLSEALIQGGFGAIVAVAIGSIIGKIWIENSLAYALGWMIDFSIPISSVFTTVGVGILVSAIAGIYPSKRASELPIVEALDYE